METAPQTSKAKTAPVCSFCGPRRSGGTSLSPPSRLPSWLPTPSLPLTAWGQSRPEDKGPSFLPALRPWLQEAGVVNKMRHVAMGTLSAFSLDSSTFFPNREECWLVPCVAPCARPGASILSARISLTFVTPWPGRRQRGHCTSGKKPSPGGPHPSPTSHSERPQKLGGATPKLKCVPLNDTLSEDIVMASGLQEVSVSDKSTSLVTSVCVTL